MNGIDKPMTLPSLRQKARVFLYTVCTCSTLFLYSGCGIEAWRPTESRHSEPVAQPRILASAPHDPTAFTQGLVIEGDTWLESTGRYGHSELREVDRTTGRVRRRVRLAPRYFGEGLTLLHGRLYQLTWREQTCIVYDRETLRELQRFTYDGEGWGLTDDGKRLYMSDGTDILRVFDPETFREERRFHVHSQEGPVSRLNELEWIGGEIWANIFQRRQLVRIDPADGRVKGFVDLSHLPPAEDVHPQQDVLNGIAFDPANGAIWVTGKNWRRLYQLEWPPGQ